MDAEVEFTSPFDSESTGFTQVDILKNALDLSGIPVEIQEPSKNARRLSLNRFYIKLNFTKLAWFSKNTSKKT